MECSWEETTLGDCLTLQRGFDLPARLRSQGSIPVFSSAGLSGFHSEAKCEPPGIVTGRYGTLGQIFWVQTAYWPHNTALYVRDFKGNDPRFLYYLLQGLNLGHHNDKSGVPGVNRNDLHRIEVLRPPVSEQRAIAQILGALDDKIELNRQMNATLEQMARALFKSWFIDFDLVLARTNGKRPSLIPRDAHKKLPTKLGEDGLPEGWKMGRLDDIAEVIMGTSPPSSTYNDIGTGTVLVNGPVEFGDRFPVKVKWTTARSRLCKTNDLIFCVRGSTTGRRVISDGEYCLGRGVCAISSRDSQTYVNLHIDYSLDNLLAKCNGSTFPNLNGPEIKSHPTLIPSDTVLELFANITKPWSEQIIENSKEISALAHARDSLLPHLLSGKIRLRQADKLVEEALT